MKAKNQIFCVFVLSIMFGTIASAAKTSENNTIKNLRAFAKLYGYIKYFHPSDEASEIDWDAFAVLSAGKVKPANTSRELKAVLEELFYPIAPTIQIYHADRPPADPLQNLPEDVNDLKIVAWQHLGVNLSDSMSAYKSIRLNRENKFLIRDSRYGFGTITQGVNAKPYRGKEIKLKAHFRAEVSGEGNQGQLWLRVDRENQNQGFFDNMGDRPIRDPAWKEYEIIGSVAEDATRIVFGGFLLGYGNVWIDEFRLFFRDTDDQWKPIEIKNPDFEDEDEDRNPKQWYARSPGYRYRITKENPYQGQTCVVIEKEKSYTNIVQLFDKHPEPGEVIKKELDRGLYCRVPLALYSDENRTLGANDRDPFGKLASELQTINKDALTADDESVRLADVIIAWNVFQHFYPYFDVVNVNWDQELTHALQEAMAAATEEEFYNMFRRFISKLQDGHANVYFPKISSTFGSFPFRADWIENQVVVVAPGDVNELEVGDVIVRIDDKKAEKVLAEEEAVISGSPQWRRLAALGRFGYGKLGTKAQLTVKRNKKTFQMEIERKKVGQIPEPKRPNIEKIEENIYYVNLTAAPTEPIREIIDELARADGVIFDMRGYPKGNHWILQNLLSVEDLSNFWMRIPRIIYPDRENIVGYSESGWHLFPMEPHIEGKVVFLTDARAISYAESVMGFVRPYKLGEIVGQPTAGTNGNVNSFTLPGGFHVTWTGMKVVQHDGSQFHLVGIRPTHPVQRTIRGVIEGRDEFLEKALEIIKQSGT